jgi:hypothetical protein
VAFGALSMLFDVVVVRVDLLADVTDEGISPERSLVQIITAILKFFEVYLMWSHCSFS